MGPPAEGGPPEQLSDWHDGIIGIMVDYLAFFDDQHGNSTMAPPLRFWHGATRGLNPALPMGMGMVWVWG